MIIRKGKFLLFPTVYLNNSTYGVAPCLWWLGLEIYWGTNAKDWAKRIKISHYRKLSNEKHLTKKITKIIHNGSSCTSIEKAKIMANEILEVIITEL